MPSCTYVHVYISDIYKSTANDNNLDDAKCQTKKLSLCWNSHPMFFQRGLAGNIPSKNFFIPVQIIMNKAINIIGTFTVRMLQQSGRLVKLGKSMTPVSTAMH